MSRFFKSVLVLFLASVVVACGGKGGKTDAKGKESKAESKAEAKADAKSDAKGEPPAATPATPATPAATTPPATPTVITDTAVPPETATPATPADTILDPDVNKYESYLIKTKDGTEFEVKDFWKSKDKVSFQKAGGDISIAIENITSIEGRLKTAQ